MIKLYFNSISLQNQVYPVSLYVPIHLLELMLYDWKDKNWGRGEKQLICTQRMYFATHIYQSPICETLGLVWEREKKQQKEKNRLLEASLGRNQLRQRFRSWEPASLEPRPNSCRAATSREFNSCPYSVSHFSHNKGRNRSSRGLVSSSKIKTLPRNRSSLCFADFDTRGRI